MKKTLALLLALLMLASVALVACNDDEKEPVSDDEEYEDGDNVKDNEDEDTDEDSEKDTEEDTEKDTEKETENNVDEWETKNDTVYTGMNNINLRKEASRNASVLKTVSAYGTSLTRTKTNGIWSEVTYNGTKGYILNELLSTDANDFAFDAVETPSTLTIKDGYQVRFHTTPFESIEFAYENVLRSSGVKAEYLAAGTTIKKVGISKNGDWLKIEVIGTINFVSGAETYTAENPGIFYIPDYQVTKGRVTDSDRPSTGNPDGPVGIG